MVCSRVIGTLLVALVAGTASAGPNAGGTIVVHNPVIAYTGDPTYCGEGAVLSSCQSANVNLVGSSPAAPGVWKVYAAFPAGSSPRYRGVSFGVQYPPDIIVTAWGNCWRIEFPDPGWPGSCTGTILDRVFTGTTPLQELYWFAGYQNGGPPECFQLTPHPTFGGYFADDSVPPIMDAIAGYGSMGFGVACQLVCPGAPSTNGACCRDQACVETIETGCACLGGTWLGIGTVCSPDPCGGPSPADEGSWGRLKSIYR